MRREEHSIGGCSVVLQIFAASLSDVEKTIEAAQQPWKGDRFRHPQQHAPGPTSWESPRTNTGTLARRQAFTACMYDRKPQPGTMNASKPPSAISRAMPGVSQPENRSVEGWREMLSRNLLR